MGSRLERSARQASRGRGLAALAVLFWLCAVLLVYGCASPPSQPDDLCEIFREKRSWYRASRDTAERWGVPEAVQLAIIHQESSFRAQARPPRRRILWIFPGPRPSSAYGYGQVVDSTWDHYRRVSGRRGADRDDFDDVSDFIGWYASRARVRAGVSPRDTRQLYLAYHEGVGGYSRGTHLEKAWLLRVAQKVDLRARRYQSQLDGCREELEQPWWWPF